MRHKICSCGSMTLEKLREKGYLGKHEGLADLNDKRVEKILRSKLCAECGAGFVPDTLKIGSNVEWIKLAPSMATQLVFQYSYELEDRPTKKDREMFLKETMMENEGVL